MSKLKFEYNIRGYRYAPESFHIYKGLPGQKKNDHAKYGGKQDNGNCGVHEDPPEEFFLL